MRKSDAVQEEKRPATEDNIAREGTHPCAPVRDTKPQPESTTVNRKNADDDKNYRLQRWHLWVQIGLLVVTSFAFLGAAIYAYIAYKQWGVVIRQANIPDQQLHASHRPWVMPEITATGPLTFTGDAASIRLAIKVKNGGTSPAVRSHVILNLLIGYSTEALLQRQASECGPADLKSWLAAEMPTAGALLLPNSEISYGVAYQVAANKNDWHLWPDGTALASVTGCIGYLDEFGTVHATLFTYNFLTRPFMPTGEVHGQLVPSLFGNDAY